MQADGKEKRCRAQGISTRRSGASFALLEYVVAQAKPIAIAEMATALVLSMPTAHRIAMQLEEHGYLRRAFGRGHLGAGGAPSVPKVTRHLAELLGAAEQLSATLD